METLSNTDLGDTASLETLLNSANWEIGILIVPQCSDSNDDASDNTAEVL
jgi:hypothetical protein